MFGENPDFFTIEEQKQFGMWPLPYLSGHMMIPYIKRMGPNVVGLEIGVLKAETSCLILENCPNVTRYIGIDPYVGYLDVDHEKTGDDMMNFLKTASENIKPYKDRFEFIIGSSDRVFNYVEDNSLNFVLIDGFHTYEQVKNDLTNYYPKLKDGGLMWAHDYNNAEVGRAVMDWRRENRISNLINTTANYLWFWSK